MVTRPNLSAAMSDLCVEDGDTNDMSVKEPVVKKRRIATENVEHRIGFGLAHAETPDASTYKVEPQDLAQSLLLSMYSELIDIESNHVISEQNRVKDQIKNKEQEISTLKHQISAITDRLENYSSVLERKETILDNIRQDNERKEERLRRDCETQLEEENEIWMQEKLEEYRTEMEKELNEHTRECMENNKLAFLNVFHDDFNKEMTKKRKEIEMFFERKKEIILNRTKRRVEDDIMKLKCTGENMCLCCGRPNVALSCQRCGDAAPYCSDKCQNDHWPVHQSYCRDQK